MGTLLTSSSPSSTSQTFQDPTFYLQVPLQVATERAISQLYYNVVRPLVPITAACAHGLAWLRRAMPCSHC